MRPEQPNPDLEALVLAEIESASGSRKRRRRPVPQPAPVPQHPEAIQEAESAILPPVSSAVSRIRGDDRNGSGLSGEEAELLDRVPLPDLGELDDLPPPRLFSPEEEAFMHRAVGFLSGRENGDMILGQIWERITREHPETFYTMPAVERPSLSDIDAGEAGEAASSDDASPPGNAGETLP
jgi:hypothetical protein